MDKSDHSFKLNREEKKIVTLTALGGLLEFYDFVIYGIFSIYFAHQFFPITNNHLLPVIQSYTIFILGYIARPIGGIIFSHFGDEYGRKRVLIITIVLMGLSSFGIGVLPTYTQMGLAAPILLLTLRLIQGLALGGELPSTYVYLSESMPKKRGSAFGLTMLGVNSGLLIGMFINQLLNFILTTDQLNAYGWRIPFILGGTLCLVSYRIRKTLHETVAFKKIHDKPAFPLLHLFAHYLPHVLAGTAITAIMSGLVVVAIIFMPTYLKDILEINNSVVSTLMPFIMLCNVITIYYTGKIANHIAPTLILGSLLILSIFLIPLSYWFISHHQTLIAGLIILSMLEGIAAMIIPLLISSLFPAVIRLTGVAFCYNVGFTLFGALAPMMISYCVIKGLNPYLIPVFYLFAIIIICSVGLLMIHKYNLLIQNHS